MIKCHIRKSLKQSVKPLSNTFRPLNRGFFIFCIILKKVLQISSLIVLLHHQTVSDMKYRIIGFTDSINECDCCGKTDLKGTYVMADDFDNELYFGSVCGSRKIGKSTTEMKGLVKNINTEKALSEMVNNANNQILQHKVLAFIEKKKIDLAYFLRKNAKLIDEFNGTKVYQYGSRCFNLDN